LDKIKAEITTINDQNQNAPENNLTPEEKAKNEIINKANKATSTLSFDEFKTALPATNDDINRIM
jgi:hypothetical protein